MNSYGIEAYADSGCQFYNSPNGRPGFTMVWMATEGRVCDTGCAWYESGKCPAYRKLTVPAKAAAGQEPQETVRQTAERLGISISEVRRRRREAGAA